jgi:hypothetical protein
MKIENNDGKLLYIDSIVSFDRMREHELLDAFAGALNISDEINEFWKRELSNRDVSVGIAIKEFEVKEFNKFRITLFTDLDNGPIHNDYIIDGNNFVSCVIENLKGMIEDIDFRMSIIDEAKRFNKDTDVVNHPSHYETGKFECIEVMQEALGTEAVKAFCICNAFKYIYRHQRKNHLEDIKKAKWYIDKYIEIHNKEESNNGE